MTAPKPCACAPGCRNEAMSGDRLCESCHDEWEGTPAWDRAYHRSHTRELADRHLADWARTRSAELVQDRLRALEAKP